jgi:CheY-like chemotaxis protein
MVVDDDEDIRALLHFALQAEGYAVLEADNGASALALLGKTAPDLILLDMKMPVMDGWAFAKAYASQPGPKAPIVVCTAALEGEKRSKDIKADGLLGKPFALSDLFEKVELLAR